jgi:hypothetical protein
MLEKPVIPLPLNIPPSKIYHFSKTWPIKRFLSKDHTLLNGIISPMYLQIIPDPRTKLTGKEYVLTILQNMLMT